MKKVLFVIPSYVMGGTTSSVINLINLLTAKYSIELLVMAHEGPRRDFFTEQKVLPENRLLAAMAGNFRTHAHAKQLLISAPLKLLRRACLGLGLDITGYVYGRVAKRVQAEEYSAVVACQEGNATWFVAQMDHHKRIAWVRCDYRRVANRRRDVGVYRKMGRIVCVSAYTKDAFCECLPEVADRVETIHNPIDVRRIVDASAESDVDARFTNGQFNILSIGRFSPVKRFEAIPGIVSRLRGAGCRFRWYILGAPVGEVYRTLRRDIQRRGIDKELVLLGEKANPYCYYARSDLVVVCSESEACPNAIMEARVLHVPVVAAEFGSVREFVHHQVDGLIAPIDAVGECVMRLIRDKELYRRLRQHSAAYVHQNDENLERVARLFDE